MTQREKRAARRAVARALKSGRLVKPDRCEHCGERLPPHRLEGHHEDHARRLDVVWLCRPCHEYITPP